MNTGVVINADLVNVFENPNDESAVLAHLSNSTQIMIDDDASTDKFYKIYTATSIEGYCEKRFISINQ